MFAKLTTPGMVSVLSSVTWFYKYTRGRAARGKGVTSLPRPADRSNPFVRDDDRGREERKKGTNSESFSGTKISLLSFLAAASKMARAP